MSEFDLIKRLLRNAPALRSDVKLGPGDDGAVLAPPAGYELVVTTDTLISGRHFPEHAVPADVGWKALAVNLSDLAAMGADPTWITVALSLPEADEAWMSDFITGFFELLESSGASLVGGDLTKGPLTISVTAMGLVPAGEALRRDGALPGHFLCVTGTPGDAALGLAHWQDPPAQKTADHDYLQTRFTRPQPRLGAGQALRGLASAAVDVSDGLAADVGHLLKASGLGAQLNVDALPRSPAFAHLAPGTSALNLQLYGGDDYELCFTVSPENMERVRTALDVELTVIGEVIPEPGLQLIDKNQRRVPTDGGGYDHFAR